MNLSELLNEIALITGILGIIVVPAIRYRCRKEKFITPYFQYEVLVHDVANGFAFPHYILILISAFNTAIIVDKHMLVLASISAGVLVIMDTLDNGRSPNLRTRKGDP